MNIRGRIIGVDESGKGDFFGPLVVAGCLASDSERALLAELGVRDSKLIAENKLLSIDRELRAHLVHAVVVMMPAEYNRRYQEIRNLNKLLAQGHAQVIKDILDQHPADLAVSDKFGKDERLETALTERQIVLPIRQIVRGEAIPQVAAASIIARAEFVRRLKDLSETYRTTIPKGAGPQVDLAGRKLVAEHGAEVLSEVAKIHFKNYHRVLNPSLFG